MQKGIIGKKIGMTQVFDENGKVVPAVSYTHLRRKVRVGSRSTALRRARWKRI